MKAVLMSIQPRWCELIASGKKTVEVRKTKPKLEVPFKVYIYETNWSNNTYWKNHHKGRLGKVIGEFVCNQITEFQSEFWDDDTQEYIRKVVHKEDWDGYPETETYYVAENGEKNYLCDSSCLTWNELREYVGQGIETFYGWHISNLVIYDKPRELGEFEIVGCQGCRDKDTCHCKFHCFGRRTLKRPPQSWCYVEEVKRDGT